MHISYVDIIVINHPGIQVIAYGDPYIYANLQHVSGDPIPPQAQLDAEIAAYPHPEPLMSGFLRIDAESDERPGTRKFIAGSSKLTIQSPDGMAGDPVFDLGTVNSTDIADFNEAAHDAVGGILVDSSTIDFTYSDVANTITAAVLTDTSTQRVRVVKNSGAVVGTRPELNFIEGSNITLTIADDVGNNQVDITVASSGGVSGYATIQEEGTSLTQRSILNFIGSGITAVDDAGNIRTNISLDVDLNAIAAFTSTGFAVRTAADTWAQRTLVAPVAGITITNPAGIAGGPTFVLANDLGAIEALNTNGILTRTGTDTWAARTIVAGSTKQTVTNGDGVAGNPTVDFGIVNLDHLADVVITGPVNHHRLVFNGTNWVNQSPSGGTFVGSFFQMSWSSTGGTSNKWLTLAGGDTSNPSDQVQWLTTWDCILRGISFSNDIAGADQTIKVISANAGSGSTSILKFTWVLLNVRIARKTDLNISFNAGDKIGIYFQDSGVEDPISPYVTLHFQITNDTVVGTTSENYSGNLSIV